MKISEYIGHWINTKFIWCREDNEGRTLPRGYGRAWDNPARHYTVIAPMPLNVLLRWLRLWGLRIRYGKWSAEDFHLRSQVYTLARQVEQLQRLNDLNMKELRHAYERNEVASSVSRAGD